MGDTTVNKINGNFKNKDILSTLQFSKKDIEILFETSDKMKKLVSEKDGTDLLSKKIMSALFYEPSSRTFGSFIAAMQRLGGGIIPIQSMENSSAGKGETLEDTAKVFESYSDVLVVRHPEEGSVAKMADAVNIPVINAGDGIGEHPTQALYDLYTIGEELGTYEKFTITFFGELKHYRSINSMAKLLYQYKDIKMNFVSPKEAGLSTKTREFLKENDIDFTETENIDDVLSETDVLYVTRVKKEFLPEKLYKKIKGKYIVDKNMLAKMKKKSIIMHNLPRIDEISKEVDDDPRSVYLRSEVKNGMYIRMALLALVLGKI